MIMYEKKHFSKPRIMSSSSEEFMTGANAIKRHYFAGDTRRAIKWKEDTNDDDDPFTDGDSDDSNASLIVIRSANEREGGCEQISTRGIPIRLRRSIKQSLALRGIPCTLFKNEKARSNVESQENLVPILGNESNLGDRFDVRHLFDSHESLRRTENNSENHDHRESKEQEYFTNELAKERYKDIQPSSTEVTTSTTRFMTGAHSGTETCADRSTTPSNVETHPKNEEDESADFKAPFPIPEDVQTPKKWGQHLKIAHTARKVHERPQLEVMLRVRQKENPSFSFLFKSDGLFPYYEFLKKRAQDETAEWPSTPPEREQQENVLGIAYSDSDEEDRNSIPEEVAKHQGSPQHSLNTNGCITFEDSFQREKVSKIQESVNAVNKKLSQRVGVKRRRWDSGNENDATREYGAEVDIDPKEKTSKGTVLFRDHSGVENAPAKESSREVNRVSNEHEETKRQRRLARAKMMKGHFRFRQETWSGGNHG